MSQPLPRQVRDPQLGEVGDPPPLPLPLPLLRRPPHSAAEPEVGERLDQGSPWEQTWEVSLQLAEELVQVRVLGQRWKPVQGLRMWQAVNAGGTWPSC